MSAYDHLLNPTGVERDLDSLVLSNGSAQLSLRTLRLASLCFARSLRDVLANWWPFRKGDVVGIVVPSAFLEPNRAKDATPDGLGKDWRISEIWIAIFGVLRAGGTVCLIPWRPNLRNSLYGLHSDALYKALPTSAEPGEDPATPRILVTPWTVNLPFPVLNYGTPPPRTHTTTIQRTELMTRTVGDMVARGRELNDDVLPNWAEADQQRWAVWWEDLKESGKDYPCGRGWTHKWFLDSSW
jgi:hypothetical protein